MAMTGGLPASAASAGLGGVGRLALFVVGAFVLFFLYNGVLKYFVWTEASYGYYWPFRLPLALHIVGGLFATLMGLFQLWSGLNRRAMGTHALTGRLYAAGVLIGAIGGLILAFTSAAYGFAWSVSLIGLSVAWLAITGTAIYCIRNRRVEAHKQWMIRSYILTFAFVTFRLVVDYMPYEAWWGISVPDMANAMIWTSWVVPLIAYEMMLAFRRQ